MHRLYLTVALAASSVVFDVPAAGAETYDYCVTRVAVDGESASRVRFSTGDSMDIGRDASAILIARHFRDARTPRVRVAGFDPLLCPAEPVLDLAYAGRESADAGAWNVRTDMTPAGVIREASALATTLYEVPFRVLGRALTSASESANRAVCQIVSC